MALEDIHKKLYEPSSDIEERKLAQEAYNPLRKDIGEAIPKEAWQNEHIVVETARPSFFEKLLADDKKKKLLKIAGVVLGSLTLVALAIVGVIKYQQGGFSEERIEIKIEGPEEIKSGTNARYKLIIFNNNRAQLQKAVLKLGYPQEIEISNSDKLIKDGFGSLKVDLGTVDSKKSLVIEFDATIFGPRDKQADLSVTLSYQPSNFSSLFQKNVNFPLVIKSSPLQFSLLTVKDVSSGEVVEIQAIIKNEGTQTFQDLNLVMSYPIGFTFGEASPMPKVDASRWQLPALAPSEQIKIVIQGRLEGAENAVKTFLGALEKNTQSGSAVKISQASGVVSVVPQRITFVQKIIGKEKLVANVGEVLNYQLVFKNNTNVALRDLILSLHIDTRMVDESNIRAQGGFFDAVTKTIIWRAADVPALKVLGPGQTGEVNFSLPIFDNFKVQTKEDKNFSLNTWADLESLDIDSALGQNKKIRSETLAVKINSKLILNVLGNYADNDLPNSGPVPLRVGQSTTFTFHLEVSNTANDLQDVVLKTKLPPGISWTNQTLSNVPGVLYNERTNEIEWKIGNLLSGTGFIDGAKKLAFQISATPASNQVDSTIDLLNDVELTAKDKFTQEEIKVSIKAISTAQIEDI